MPHDAGDAGRARVPGLPQCHDPTLDATPWSGGDTVRSTRAILESGNAFFLVAAPPDIGPVPRDPHRRGRVGDGPATFDALTEPAVDLRG